MNLRYRERLYRDEEGDEIESLAALRVHAIAKANDLIRLSRSLVIRNWFDCSFEITNDNGQVVLILPFGETVRELNYD